MNIKNTLFLTEGKDRKRGERYVVCTYPPTFHAIPGNFQDIIKDLISKTSYRLVSINPDCDALLVKSTYTRSLLFPGSYRYEWRYVTIQD